MPNLLDWTFYLTWINVLLMKHKFINFEWIVINLLIVHNLLINYMNLKRVNTEAAAHRCFITAVSRYSSKYVLFKILQYLVENICVRVSVTGFLWKLRNFLRTAFFIKHLRWLLLKNSQISQENIGGGVIDLSFNKYNRIR